MCWDARAGGGWCRPKYRGRGEADSADADAGTGTRWSRSGRQQQRSRSLRWASKAVGGNVSTRGVRLEGEGQQERVRGSRAPNHARESAEVIHCG
jgi:hypothetical protein